MARKVTPQEFLDKTEFIKHLPDGGGSWGKGVTMTLADQAREIARLEKTQAGIKAQIRDRLKLMRTTADRAEREAELVGYTKDQITEAQVEVEVKNQDVPEKGEAGGDSDKE